MIKNLRKCLNLIILLLLTCCGVAKAETSDDMAYPKNPTGWSQSGILQTGNIQRGVGLQAEFPVLGNYTIQFNLNAIRFAAGSRRVTAQATIDWKVRGNAVRRVISVSDGTAITGTSEAVTVRLVDATNAPPVPSIEYVASIQVAYGTRGSNKQPPYLVLPEESVSPGGVTTIDIPDDIGANSVFVVAGSTANIAMGLVRVTQIGGNGPTYDPRFYDWVPLDPGIARLQFSVDAAAGGAVSFTSYLGIDG